MVSSDFQRCAPIYSEFISKTQDQTPILSSINFVSSASSAADIELVHVKGVHGPMKIAYVVVG